MGYWAEETILRKRTNPLLGMWGVPVGGLGGQQQGSWLVGSGAPPKPHSHGEEPQPPPQVSLTSLLSVDRRPAEPRRGFVVWGVFFLFFCILFLKAPTLTPGPVLYLQYQKQNL